MTPTDSIGWPLVFRAGPLIPMADRHQVGRVPERFTLAQFWELPVLDPVADVLYSGPPYKQWRQLVSGRWHVVERQYSLGCGIAYSYPITLAPTAAELAAWSAGRITQPDPCRSSTVPESDA